MMVEVLQIVLLVPGIFSAFFHSFFLVYICCRFYNKTHATFCFSCIKQPQTDGNKPDINHLRLFNVSENNLSEISSSNVHLSSASTEACSSNSMIVSENLSRQQLKGTKQEKSGLHINPKIKGFFIASVSFALITSLWYILIIVLNQFTNYKIPCLFQNLILVWFGLSRTSTQAMFYHRLVSSMDKLATLRQNTLLFTIAVKIYPILINPRSIVTFDLSF